MPPGHDPIERTWREALPATTEAWLVRLAGRRAHAARATPTTRPRPAASSRTPTDADPRRPRCGHASPRSSRRSWPPTSRATPDAKAASGPAAGPPRPPSSPTSGVASQTEYRPHVQELLVRASSSAPTCRSASPKKVKVLGQQLVLYRKPSDGSVVAMSDLCVHRGAALSGGSSRATASSAPTTAGSTSPEGDVREDPRAPRQGHPAQGPHRLLPGRREVHDDLGLHGRPARGGAAADPRLVGRRRHRDLPRRHRRVPLEVQLRADPRERRRHRAHAVRARAAPSATRRSPRCPSSRSRPRRGTARPRSKLNPPKPEGIWGKMNPDKARTCKSRPPVPVSTTWWLPNVILLEVGPADGQAQDLRRQHPDRRGDHPGQVHRPAHLLQGQVGRPGRPQAGLQGALRRTRRSSTRSVPSCCPSTCPTSCTSRATTTRCSTAAGAAS